MRKAPRKGGFSTELRRWNNSSQARTCIDLARSLSGDQLRAVRRGRGDERAENGIPIKKNSDRISPAWLLVGAFRSGVAPAYPGPRSRRILQCYLLGIIGDPVI